MTEATGYKCAKCGKWHDFPPYVFAHWDVSLVHTCGCGTKARVFRGRTVLVPSPVEESKE